MRTEIACARLDDDNTLLLVLPELPAGPGYHLCYAQGYFEASKEHLSLHTIPADAKDPATIHLAQAYAKHAQCRVTFINQWRTLP